MSKCSIKVIIVVLLSVLFTHCSKNGDDLIPYRDGKRWGFSDIDKNIVVPTNYVKVERFQNGLAKVYLNSKVGMINTSGEEIVPIIYSGIKDFKEGYALYWGNNEYGFIDEGGKIIPLPNYTNVKEFNEGMAIVCKGSKYGFINTDMVEVIKPRYRDVGDFSNGRALVYSSTDDNRKCGYIDKAGNEIVPKNREVHI